MKYRKFKTVLKRVRRKVAGYKTYKKRKEMNQRPVMRTMANYSAGMTGSHVTK